MNIARFVFGPFTENTYLVYNESKACIIIDPGCTTEEEQQELSSFIQKQNLTPTLLLLTHGHIDHIAGLDFVTKAYHLEPYLNPNDLYFLENVEKTAVNYGISVDKYLGPVNPIDESSKLNFEGTEIKILETPGHSPGSLCFLLSPQMLIGGDVLFREGIGRTDLYMCNNQDLKSSIQQKLYTLDGDVVVYPGHGTYTTIGHEKVRNPFVRGA